MRPILFWLGRLPVYSYAVFTGAGLFAGFLRARQELARRDLPVSLLWHTVPAVGALSLVGGRLLYVAFHRAQFSGDWRLLFTRWRPGLSFHGVMFGSVAGAWCVARRAKTPLSDLLDVLAPAAALGHAVGRIGCFFNGCCYGKRTTLPWCILRQQR
jgi:phosphatidylglycerol:prolipoprotein diacylglycerol transferase